MYESGKKLTNQKPRNIRKNKINSVSNLSIWKLKKKENKEMEDRQINDRIIRDILTNVVTAGEKNRKSTLEKKEKTNDRLIKDLIMGDIGRIFKKKKKININWK